MLACRLAPAVPQGSSEAAKVQLDVEVLEPGTAEDHADGREGSACSVS